MAGTRLRGGVDGLPAAGMQADCRSLQMIAVAFCGSHDVKGVVDLRSAELRLVCADQYFAAESLFYQRQLIAAAGGDIRDAFAETGAVCKATGQAEPACPRPTWRQWCAGALWASSAPRDD